MTTFADALTITDLAPAAPVAAHNACHRQCVARAREAALWAVLAGLELLSLKLTLPRGAWLPWVAVNCEYSSRTASSYLGAAERAVARLGGNPDFADSAPSAMGARNFRALREHIAELLARAHLDEQRAALIAALIAARRPAKPAPELPPPAPAKPRAPRPTGPRGITAKAAPALVSRLRLSPPEVLHTVLSELRPQIEHWLQTQYQQ